MNSPLRVLSLCSGIGGIDIAAEWAGFQIVGQIENNPFCQVILRQHWPAVPLLSDLKEVATYEKEELEDIFGRVDFLVGGIPCQPFSSAGKRRGTADDRHLWPYAATLIEKFQPTWVLIENVRNFANMALDLVLSDLESLHYETQAFIFPACATGAPHVRERCFILAYHPGQRGGAWRAESARQQGQSDVDSHGTKLANSGSAGWEKQHTPAVSGTMGHVARRKIAPGTLADAQYGRQEWGSCHTDQPGAIVLCGQPGTGTEPQSRMGGNAYGISTRLDTARWPAPPGEQYEWEPPRTIKGRQKWRRQRLEALGNAVNPYQVWPFMALIKQAEEEMEETA